MTQKVVVDVSPAEPSWPRTFGNGVLAIEAGATYMIHGRGDGAILHVRRSESEHLWEIVAINPDLDIEGIIVGFPDFESAARWWLDPKPVLGFPAQVLFETMKPGEYFTTSGGTLYVVSSNGRDCISVRDGHTSYPGPNVSVTPFYGTITIEVKPG